MRAKDATNISRMLFGLSQLKILYLLQNHIFRSRKLHGICNFSSLDAKCPLNLITIKLAVADQNAINLQTR